MRSGGFENNKKVIYAILNYDEANVLVEADKWKEMSRGGIGGVYE